MIDFGEFEVGSCNVRKLGEELGIGVVWVWIRVDMVDVCLRERRTVDSLLGGSGDNLCIDSRQVL